MVTLGIPTLNRYDLLKVTIRSAETGTLKPDRYIVIDNGGKFKRDSFYDTLGDRLVVKSFGKNLGVAASWNVLSRETPDIRIISNDDISFFEDSIEILVKSFSTDKVIYPAGIPSTNSFSCFILPDEIIKLVGEFDEKISPGYAYFEDNDYYRRMILQGVPLVGVPECKLNHFGSSTLRSLTEKEKREHHEKFKKAKDYYIKKWGGEPGKEKHRIPFGKR